VNPIEQRRWAGCVGSFRGLGAALGAHGCDFPCDLFGRHHAGLSDRRHTIHGRKQGINLLRLELIAQPALQLCRRQQARALRVLRQLVGQG
jgi:hypothetical protein